MALRFLRLMEQLLDQIQQASLMWWRRDEEESEALSARGFLMKALRFVNGDGKDEQERSSIVSIQCISNFFGCITIS
jgi:hypothetical protein